MIRGKKNDENCILIREIRGKKMKFEELKQLMISEQIINRGIIESKIISAFQKVPRHLFVPRMMVRQAYDDHPLGIGEGQTISQPYIVALMMQLLELKDNDIVLEIGTGSGYQTALLAEIAKEVYTIERIESLSGNARKVLQELGYENIYYQVGDGTLGWKMSQNNEKKFTKIIATASPPEIPKSLTDQLTENGLLVIPTGDRIYQNLILVRKEKGQLRKSNYGGCAFVPLIGEEGWSL